MKTAHFVMQGKGGCGKSLIAATLAQYLAASGDTPLCVDTDPVNRTFSRTKALGVRGLELLDSARQIDSRQFDTLIEMLLEHDGDAVVDNGASVFVPLMAYLAQSGALDLLRASGVDVVLHVPIIGGDALDDTANGFNALMSSTGADAVVWINPHFGAVTRDGKPFRDSTLATRYASRLRGVVELPEWDRATFGKDLAQMREHGLTFDEAANKPEYSAMARHRLSRMRLMLFSLLDGCALHDSKEAA